MAKVRIGINGFGRIGRVVLRAAFEKYANDVEVVAINDLSHADQSAHLLKYDTTHGIFSKEVTYKENSIFVDGREIKLTAIKDPAQIPWKSYGVDIVFECTGAFKDKEDFMKHITAGAKKVLVSAPATSDLTVVYGINHAKYDPNKHQVVSNASCTTNCLAPVAKILNDHFGIDRGLMTTVHSFTNDQRVLDAPHKDLRRARTATSSIIPTSTGAAKTVVKILPELEGRIDGTSVRVPTQNVSLVDFTFTSQKPMTVQSINQALSEASQTALKGILAVEAKPLVSVDFNGNTHSSIVDLECTMVLGTNFAKIFSWYDNETGFSYRMLDVAVHMAKTGL